LSDVPVGLGVLIIVGNADIVEDCWVQFGGTGTEIASYDRRIVMPTIFCFGTCGAQVVEAKSRTNMLTLTEELETQIVVN
jgi:hypothetical protein